MLEIEFRRSSRARTKNSYRIFLVESLTHVDLNVTLSNDNACRHDHVVKYPL